MMTLEGRPDEQAAVVAEEALRRALRLVPARCRAAVAWDCIVQKDRAVGQLDQMSWPD